MSMGSIFTKAYICNHNKIRIILFYLADGFLHDSMLIIRTTSHFILMCRNAKNKNRRNTCFFDTVQFLMPHGIQGF